MQTVKFVYSGSEKRKFTVMGRDQVIVSGDDNSTQFIFIFPDSYQSYSKEIVWDGFYIKDAFDEITVARYPIVNDTFYVPQEVTLPNSGREISFQVVMYKPQDEEDESSLEITESSQLYPVYISKSATGEQLDVDLDSVSQLIQKAYVTSAYDVDSETDRPIVKFLSLQGREYTLPLNMPYLDENGIVAEQFLPPRQDVEVLTFSDVAEMMEDTSAKPPDFAIITQGTQGSEIDYAGNIFIKTEETTDYDGWMLIHSKYIEDNFDNKVDKIPGYSLVEDSEIQKLQTVEEGAEENVQQDWNVSDVTSDQYIKNKPTLGTAQQKDVGTQQGEIPLLNSSGKLPNTTIPPLAIGEIIEWPQGIAPTKQNLVLLSDAEQSDIAIVSEGTVEDKGVYFLNGTYSVLADWIQIVGPSNVISVNGKDGIVTLGLSDLDGITQGELNAIDSGITSQLVSQISTNQSDISDIKSEIGSEQTQGTILNRIQTNEDDIDTLNGQMSTVQTKLATVQEGAEVNVQQNWTESNTSSDQYIMNKPNLATVATSGSYNDLSDKPAIPQAQVNSDWDAVSGVAMILNKPNLATVATSGSYNDLSDKPSIPDPQVQSDWLETDTSAPSYIKNKPSVPSQQIQQDWDETNISEPSYIKNKPTIPQAQVNSDWNASSGVSQILNKPNLATVATSGDYNDLSNKPTIPQAQVNSDWNASTGVASILNKPSLATVATSGSYDDLSDKPSIPQAQVNSDWNSTTGVSEILNKPTLATVATSGSYDDLSDKPSIPDPQVQSDWTEADTTDPSYIKNKPTIPQAQVNSDWDATSGVAQILNKPSLATVATSGSYNDLSNKPTIPQAQVNSDWDASTGVAQILNKPTLATVATSGSYNDLSNKPSIPQAQVNSDWDASTGVASILNKPNLATVATSGSYEDLSDKPSIPQAQVNSDWNASSGVAQILNKPTLSSVATSGDYNDLSNKPTIPTKVSDLTNDTGFITKAVNDLTNYYTKTDTYTKTEVNNLLSTKLKFAVVEQLPLTGEENTIYLVPAQHSTTGNEKDEYIWVNNDWELIGSTEFQLDITQNASGITINNTSLQSATSTQTGLMTSTQASKLDSIAQGAEVNVNADWNASTGDAQILNKPTLATVATSGSYDDLSNKPSIPQAQVNSDWSQSSGVAQILNKPTLATVATSGSYNDLSDKPTIPQAQIQSDWDQTDSTAVDFIKNKPTDLGGIDYTEVQTKAEMEQLTASQGDIVKVVNDGTNNGLYIYDEHEVLVKIDKIACSSQTTFFLTSNGKLYGMGYNYYGQQGNGQSGSGQKVTTPTRIGASLGTIVDVVCSDDTTYFITSNGELYGAGKNNYGQQGDGTTTDVHTFTQIGSNISNISKVVCSGETMFFLTDSGALYGTGKNTSYEQGDGTGTNVLTPTQIGSSLGTITDVACAIGSTFFITSDGKLYGMGDNSWGQKGTGNYSSVKTPTQIGSTLGTISKVVCDEMLTFFITSDGKLYGMGAGENGQMGDGQESDTNSPLRIGPTLGTVTDVVCNNDTVFFITSDGKLYGMGSNFRGQQGNGQSGSSVYTCTQIGSTLGNITKVFSCYQGTFFITSDGRLYGMGGNGMGQQGDGTTTDVHTPTQIGSTLGTVVDGACSSNTTFFITSDGKLYGMGDNAFGAIGVPSVGDTCTTPTQIASDIAPKTETVFGFVLMAKEPNIVTTPPSSVSTDTQIPTSKAVYTALTNGTVSKVGTTTVGSLSVPVYLESGVPTAITLGSIATGNTGLVTGGAVYSAINTCAKLGADNIFTGMNSVATIKNCNLNLYPIMTPINGGVLNYYKACRIPKNTTSNEYWRFYFTIGWMNFGPTAYEVYLDYGPNNAMSFYADAKAVSLDGSMLTNLKLCKDSNDYWYLLIKRSRTYESEIFTGMYTVDAYGELLPISNITFYTDVIDEPVASTYPTILDATPMYLYKNGYKIVQREVKAVGSTIEEYKATISSSNVGDEFYASNISIRNPEDTGNYLIYHFNGVVASKSNSQIYVPGNAWIQIGNYLFISTGGIYLSFDGTITIQYNDSNANMIKTTTGTVVGFFGFSTTKYT